MKKILYLLMIPLLWVSCSSEDDVDPYEKLTGYWVVEECEAVLYSTFNEDKLEIVPTEKTIYYRFKKGDERVSQYIFDEERALDFSINSLKIYQELPYGKNVASYIPRIEGTKMRASSPSSGNKELYYKFKKDTLILFKENSQALAPPNKVWIQSKLVKQ